LDVLKTTGLKIWNINGMIHLLRLMQDKSLYVRLKCINYYVTPLFFSAIQQEWCSISPHEADIF